MIESIQLLRAAAALAVVMHHTALFGNGAWGVDLFFVISGFIIAYVTETDRRHFLLKRIIRIVPLYWLGTLAVFQVVLLKPEWVGGIEPRLDYLLKSLFFLPFDKDGQVQPLLFLGWTLNYEIFFYLIFSASMGLSHRYRCEIAAAVLCIATLLGFLTSNHNVIVAFFTDSLLLEFIFGLLLYRLLRSASWRQQFEQPWVRAAGTLCLIVLPFYMTSVAEHVVAIDRALLWGMPAAVGFLIMQLCWGRCSLPGWIVNLGNASYSLYLFHPYVLRMISTQMGAFAPWSMFELYLLAVCAIALCCLLALVCFAYMERPLTQFLRRRLVSTG